MEMNWETGYRIFFSTLIIILLISLIFTLVKIVKKVNKANQLYEVYKSYFYFAVSFLLLIFPITEKKYKFLIFIILEINLLKSINKIINSKNIIGMIVNINLFLTFVLAIIFHANNQVHFIYILISISTSCICLNYFNNLKNNLSSGFILEDPKTILILGLFFCYTLTLPLDVTAAYLYFNNKIKIISPFENRNDNISNIYTTLSYLEISSYLILNYSFNKSLNYIKK